MLSLFNSVPQSANCAGKSADLFEHTSICEEQVYTIARTSGRLCEPAMSIFVENLTHFYSYMNVFNKL